MFIKSVRELKGAGVWKDFSAPADLCFAPRTLIYGFNGSGKTTLSRVFSSIQRTELEERLPAETTFKVEASDGAATTQKPISNLFGKNLLVFNSDFVSRNFEWDSSSTNGIAYLSEKKVEARREFDELTPKVAASQQATKAKKGKKGEAERAFSSFKTKVARSIREVASSSAYTQSYDARKIQGHYSKASFGPEKVLSHEDLKKNQALLSQRDPLPLLSFSPILPDGLADWFRTSLGLLSQQISTIAQSEFEENSDALRWVEEGLHYHEGQGLSNCLLCGSAFSRERRDQLKELFDKSWTEALRTLEQAKDKGREHQVNLRELYSSIPKETEISADERSEFASQKVAAENAITQLGLSVGELLKGLEVRVANPTKEVSTSGKLNSFDMDDWLRGYEEIQQALSGVVTRHNEAFRTFSTLQGDAFSAIEGHVLATNQSEWNDLLKAVDDTKAELQEAQETERTLSNRQLALQNDLQDHGVGADKMNELIWAYLGHKELRLVAEEGGYKIIRPNGDPATELSEGERTAVSFCYFLTQLQAEGRNLKELVLVIDDPISSLDTAARTYAYSLMTRMTKKCAQVVVLTHNTSFMNMVKREFQTLQRRKDGEQYMALLSLDCRSPGDGVDRTTTLVEMPNLLVKYDSEYHYLFSLVRDAAESQSTDYLYLLPNATRKLLEMFSTFCSPGQSSFAGALGDHHDKVKDKLDVRALERLVQIESHGTITGLGSLPDLTLEEALRAAESAIKFIQEVGKDHYKKMVASLP